MNEPPFDLAAQRDAPFHFDSRHQYFMKNFYDEYILGENDMTVEVPANKAGLLHVDTFHNIQQQTGAFAGIMRSVESEML